MDANTIQSALTELHSEISRASMELSRKKANSISLALYFKGYPAHERFLRKQFMATRQQVSPTEIVEKYYVKHRCRHNGNIFIIGFRIVTEYGENSCRVKMSAFLEDNNDGC